MIEGWTANQFDATSGATTWIRVKSLLNGNACMIIQGIKNKWYMGSIQMSPIYDNTTRGIAKTPVFKDFKECSNTLHSWWMQFIKQESELIRADVITED